MVPMPKRPSNVWRSFSANLRTRTNLSQRPRHQNSRVRAVAIEITRESRIDSYPTVIPRRGSVHEMENAVVRAQREAHMRGGAQARAIARNDPNDVAVPQLRLDR